MEEEEEGELVCLGEEDTSRSHHRNVDQDELFIDRLRRLILIGREQVKEGVCTAPCTEFPLYVDPNNSLAVARIRGDI